MPPAQTTALLPLLFALFIACTVGRALAEPAATAAGNEAGVDVVHEPWRSDRPRWTFNAYWENDGGPLKRNNLEDRHYSNGFGFSLTFQPQWAHELQDHVPFAEQFGEARTAVGLHIGHLIFTPADLTVPTLIVDDRPYAGHLYGGVFWQRDNGRSLDHFQLDLGIVGPNAMGEEIQSNIHRWFDGDDPQGWDNQIDNEVTVQFYLRKKWRFDIAEFGKMELPVGVQVIPAVEAAVGTVYIHAEAAVTLRAGFNLPDDYGPGRLQDFASATGDQPDGWTLYGYVRGRARGVVHDIFIEGNVFSDSHGVEEEAFRGYLQVGIVFAWQGPSVNVEVGYSQTFMTEAFKKQDSGEAFGALTAGVWFSF